MLHLYKAPEWKIVNYENKDKIKTMISTDTTIGLVPATGSNPLKCVGELLEPASNKRPRLEFVQQQQGPLGFIWDNQHHSCPYDALYSINLKQNL